MTASFLLGIIGAGAAIVLFIYHFQVRIWPIISGLMGSGNAAADERSARLIDRYYTENNKLDARLRTVEMSSPQLHLIRTAVNGNEARCLLINKGGTASNLQVESEGVVIVVEPTHQLENGQTGSISLRNIDPASEHLKFQLSYKDSYGLRAVRTYSYSEAVKNFIEV